MTSPTEDFIDSERMRNRNIRLGVHEEEALLRAAEADDRNVSMEIRMILTGRLPNLVQRGLLCPECLQVDCTRHKQKRAPRQEKVAG